MYVAHPLKLGALAAGPEAPTGSTSCPSAPTPIKPRGTHVSAAAESARGLNRRSSEKEAELDGTSLGSLESRRSNGAVPGHGMKARGGIEQDQAGCSRACRPSVEQKMPAAGHCTVAIVGETEIISRSTGPRQGRAEAVAAVNRQISEPGVKTAPSRRPRSAACHHSVGHTPDKTGSVTRWRMPSRGCRRMLLLLAFGASETKKFSSALMAQPRAWKSVGGNRLTQPE